MHGCRTSNTQTSTTPDIHHTRSHSVVDVLLYTRCSGCSVWWLSFFTNGVVWWMSYFTHCIRDVWCGGCRQILISITIHNSHSGLPQPKAAHSTHHATQHKSCNSFTQNSSEQSHTGRRCPRCHETSGAPWSPRQPNIIGKAAEAFIDASLALFLAFLQNILQLSARL